MLTHTCKHVHVDMYLYIHSGYRYGRIPWADADITVLVDEKGVPKFCLQELVTKVRYKDMYVHVHIRMYVYIRSCGLGVLYYSIATCTCISLVI